MFTNSMAQRATTISLSILVTVEMFNAMNRTNFGDPNSSIGNAVAGQISSTAPARIMQLALKVVF